MDPQVISGIGPGVAAVLKRSNISSVEELAAADPHHLASLLSDIRGMSIARTARWVSDAQQLHAPSSEQASDPGLRGDVSVDVPTSFGAPHRETLVLTVVVGTDGAILQSAAKHVGSDLEHRWPGWSADRLEAFVAATCGISTGEAELETPTSEAIASAGAADAPTSDRPLRPLAIFDLGPLAGGGSRTVTRDLVSEALKVLQPSRYRLTGWARGIGSKSKSIIGTQTGEVEPGQPIVVELGPTDIPDGIHRVVVELETATLG
jgi:hypothetical protein